MRELADREDSPWLLVTDAKHVQVARFLSLMNSPGEGAFTVDEDRAKIAHVLHQVFKHKLRVYLQKGDIAKFRLLLNREAALMRGLPTESLGDPLPGFHPSAAAQPDSAEAFLRQNGFRKLLERDSLGFTPLCYAALTLGCFSSPPPVIIKPPLPPNILILNALPSPLPYTVI